MKNIERIKKKKKKKTKNRENCYFSSCVFVEGIEKWERENVYNFLCLVGEKMKKRNSN
jgi:hypothetical protein